MLPVLNLPQSITNDVEKESSKQINQSSHGFVVGNWLRYNGTNYVLADATTGPNSEVLGVVSAVTDVDNFELVAGGWVTLSGLTIGNQYLSNTPGQISTTEGTVIKSVGYAVSSTEMFVRILHGIT